MRGELTMTIICRDCEHQYGAWRAHCPACGSEAPRAAREAMLKPREDAKPKRERAPREDACIFCHRKGAKDRCPHCNERIHHNCQGIHSEPCKQFQVERQAIIGGANVAREINTLLGRTS
jgi:hypothetical protein